MTGDAKAADLTATEAAVLRAFATTYAATPSTVSVRTLVSPDDVDRILDDLAKRGYLKVETFSSWAARDEPIYLATRAAVRAIQRPRPRLAATMMFAQLIVFAAVALMLILDEDPATVVIATGVAAMAGLTAPLAIERVVQSWRMRRLDR